MRSIVLLTGTALVLTSCNQTDKIANNQAAQVESAQSPAGVNKMSSMAVIDPLTATSAGLSIASSLKSLFSSNSGERDLKKIRKQLGEIQQQNRQILTTLGEIVTILNNLGVTIRENVRLEQVFNLEASISGQGDQLYETWIAELDDRRAQRQAADRYRSHILPEVRNLTHELMNEGYGYSAFDSVGHGMLMELWMSRRTGERASFRQQAGGTYAAYFDRALNSATPGTPGYALAQAVAQRDRMKAILDSADSRIAAGYSMNRDYDARPHTSGDGRTTTYRRMRETKSAKGNQNDGYTLSVTTTVLSQRVEREPPDRPHCGMCIQLDNANKAADLAKAGSATKSLAPDPTPTNGTPEAMVNYWNAVRATLQQSSKEAEALGKTNETLRIFQAEARLAQQGS